MPKQKTFELHVTIDKKDEQATVMFEAACRHLGVKALTLQNISYQGSSTPDVLTASKLTGTDEQAFAELQRIAMSLRTRGLDVVREKIETVPWHEQAPSGLWKRYGMMPGQYFEAHTNLRHEPEQANDVLNRAKQLGMFVSADSAKSEMHKIVTFRSHAGVREWFEETLRAKEQQLAQDFYVRAAQVEFALFDSNPEHDIEWVNSWD